MEHAYPVPAQPLGATAPTDGKDRVAPRRGHHIPGHTVTTGPETQEQRADRPGVEHDHAAGDHRYCDITCEDEFPGQELRNAILTRAIPGAATMLDELLRRAALAPPSARHVLTESEHDRAWHAIEGSAGEEGADPGTVLAAVLRALRIEAPVAPAVTGLVPR
ncbi:hypothetical protein ACFC34_38185 [Streptomyces sp. NPDC056053]|uniref:hypothetical protein n=1 Tax=Streptomyces sp. NPDC056053 TaxID=3345696 RepID=UPI0035DA0FFD